MDRPLPNSYWVIPGRLLAGEYPPGRDKQLGEAGRARVRDLLAVGISCFVDLTEEGECPPYHPLLPPTVTYLRRSIRDQRVPRRPTQMRRILDEIGGVLTAGGNIYLHCRAGIGRTGLVAGCFLVEQGNEGEHALRELNVLWTQQCARAPLWPVIPQTPEQAEYIRRWTPRAPRRRRAAARAPAPATAPAADNAVAAAGAAPAAGADLSDAELAPVRSLRERFQGAMLGLAVGDALAAATQYRRAGSFAPVGDMLGGGPFDLPRGAWSDDTAMALCLAESLAERERFDAADQLARYGRWQREGHLSATGACLGVTAATARALAAAPWRPPPLARTQLLAQRDPEPLSRVAPVVLHAYPDEEQAIALAAESARATCHAPRVLDACRLLAAMLHAALAGQSRARILSPPAAVFGAHALHAEVAAVAARSYGADFAPPAADGGVVAALDLARWCLASTASFREGALRAANLGGDSDVIAAVYGQLAGAHYGVGAIPAAWRQVLARATLIGELGDRLLRNALVRLGEQAAAT
ncbi:MAG TPA: ADP-ribosylglycohydrolase family protein [Steroidobacteraceae bacterium]|nr:ADP-ribosylglycohydrolase family protein [Steroidobacteraceae bacterium]